MATLTELKGNVKLSEDTGAALTLYKPITPAYAYSYTTTTIPNEIGARCDIGGTGGSPVTVTGDGAWRYYLYVNNVPKGIYLFQYWANLGVGATYTSGLDAQNNLLFQTSIYQRATAFTTAGDQTFATPPLSQLYAGLMANLVNATNQEAPSYPVYIDSDTPNVAFAMKCTTNINPPTYHGLMLWRIA